MKKIKINCLAMIREIRDQLYLENKDKSDQEKIQFISETARSFEKNEKCRKAEKKKKAA